MSTAIEFENISKQYRLGFVSSKTLSHDLSRWWTMNVLHKEDPYLKIGETNDRTHKGESDYVWALKDINFKVEQGDVLGIIGKNGAGKSTLLKILSRVTTPSTGRIRARGRIASLLEVGTGFHQEMTGRENIFMNGAIMGMTKAEISRKLDEIVDFSGCERYLDTPVKRYSSGMMVRLGFAVAAHLDPEILVVDEVLAVGDAEFQKKAIGKMQDISHGEGRTVLFVSHNMGAVRNLCKKGFVLKEGSIDFVGTASECVDYYLSSHADKDLVSCKIDDSVRYKEEFLSEEIVFLSVGFLKKKRVFSSTESIEFEFEIYSKINVDNCRINATIYSMDGSAVGAVSNMSFFSIRSSQKKIVILSILDHNLVFGEYSVSFSIGLGNTLTAQKDFDIIQNVLSFKINKYSSQSDDFFSQWNRSWGNIIFKSETKVIDKGV